MAILSASSTPEVSPDINMTPLIDVMLVLIIMLVITIPIQTHSVKLDLSSGPPVLTEVNPIKNVVLVTRTGTLLWNGEAVDACQMQQSRLGRH